MLKIQSLANGMGAIAGGLRSILFPALGTKILTPPRRPKTLSGDTATLAWTDRPTRSPEENHEIVLIRRSFMDAVNTTFMIKNFGLKTDLGERTPQDLIFEATVANSMTSDINEMKDNRLRYGMLSIAEIFNRKDPKAIVSHEQCMRWFDDVSQSFIRDRKLLPTLRELGVTAP